MNKKKSDMLFSTELDMSTSAVTYTIGGVKVEFPAKAYPSQVSMMDKIIRGCSKAQNCLLESPTGSGKTLALLCGALAWQKAEKKRLDEAYAVEMVEYNRKKNELEAQQKQHLDAAQKTVCDDEKSSGSAMDISISTSTTFEVVELSDSEDSEVFRHATKRVKVGINVSVAKNDLRANVTQPENSKEVPTSKTRAEEKQIQMPKYNRPPRIYFCTRTHKQVSQVINELRRTAYNDAKSTVLSSRTHSCIHERGYDPKVNKTELCHQLLDPRSGLSCKFRKNVRNFCTFDYLNMHTFPSLWELEDLVAFGKKKTVCPYYTARELMTDADIVFCPYNYLIDPLIRSSMNITLKGDIIIVDEAHNIEDSCREAASFSVLQDHLTDSIHECEDLLKTVKGSLKESPCTQIINIICSVSKWIDRHRNDVVDLTDYDQGKYTMYGPQAVDSFKDYEFGPTNFENFANNYAMLTAEEKSMEESSMEEEFSSTISGSTKALLEGLLLILSLLYDQKYMNDYHVVLTKSFSPQYNEAPEPDGDGWFNRRKKKTKTLSQWRYSLNFWCFNPAATFTRIKENARCIVLSSGTLSPMNTFQSELGALFPITLEANHVIDASQCWVASLGVGPNNVVLDGKFASTSTYQFQDEISHVILKICSFVPHGVLCFVPSYSLLEKLYERWSTTGILNEISKHKYVLCEPRKGDELDDLLRQYYDGIETTEDAVIGKGVTGSLLLAVCRGKVSEGLDFADKNARVVVTIGIPFPNIKDNQIMLKKSYNDKHQHSKGLLNGNEWYQTQAYRALNQALGRCIRHRRDWGAILLIDDRFRNNHYYKSLSKWVRNKVTHHYSYPEMIDSLSCFIESRLRIEKQGS